MKRFWIVVMMLVGLGLIVSIERSTAEMVQVRVNRWLEVSQVTGKVVYQRGTTAQPAQVGTRLRAIGEALVTAKRSSALLKLDTDLGTIQVAENTTLRIQQLQTTPAGGQLTQLQVPRGQVRLQLRRFTHPESRFQVETPAGVSGVRGTEFGLSVFPNGKTGVATRSGSVVTTAAGQSLAVNAGFQVVLMPGEPPKPPVPLSENTYLKIDQLAELDTQKVRVVGETDPVNLLEVENIALTTDSTGQFAITVPLPVNRRVTAQVTTPLGKQQIYEIAVPWTRQP